MELQNFMLMDSGTGRELLFYLIFALSSSRSRPTLQVNAKIYTVFVYLYACMCSNEVCQKFCFLSQMLGTLLQYKKKRDLCNFL